MATPKSIINRFSTIATDPLRNFRFQAVFTKSSNGKEPFSTKILTGSEAKYPENGASSGWVGGFTYVSGLNITTQNISYREGGYNTTVHQIPGMTTFSPVTFQRGALYGNDQAITWMRSLFAAAAGDGIAIGANKDFRVDVEIYVMDHPNAGTGAGTGAVDDNTPKMGFKIHNAWISQLNYSDLNAGDGGIFFETMTLVHEGLAAFYVKDDFTRI